MSHFRHEASRSNLRRPKTFLAISDGLEDDLIALERARTAGSCRCFAAKRSSHLMNGWIPWSSTSSTLWLSENPESGKSFLASHVIDYLEANNSNCSYFFIKHGIETRSSVSDCMRSLAYHMAIRNVDVRKMFLVLEVEGATHNKGDERSIWRDIFLGGILQAPLGKIQ